MCLEPRNITDSAFDPLVRINQPITDVGIAVDACVGGQVCSRDLRSDTTDDTRARLSCQSVKNGPALVDALGVIGDDLGAPDRKARRNLRYRSPA